MGIGKHTEGAIVFTLPPGKAKPQIWSASEDRDELGPESVLGPAIARLLAFVLLGEAASSDALNHALAGHDASEQGRGEYDDRRRKILERARRKLAAVARRPPDKVIVDNGDGGLRLGEGIALYGAVDLRRLDDGEP